MISLPRKLVSAGILLEVNDKYLLAHPTHKVGTTGGWGIPKGRTDPGESIRETAFREFREEAGVDCNEPGFGLTIEKHPFYTYDVEGKDKTGRFIKTVYVFRGYAKGPWLDIWNFPFSCSTRVATGELEIADYRWVSVDEALTIVAKSQRGIFEFIQKYEQLNNANQTKTSNQASVQGVRNSGASRPLQG